MKSEEKLEEMIEKMERKGIYAAAVQETWREGDEQLEGPVPAWTRAPEEAVERETTYEPGSGSGSGVGAQGSGLGRASGFGGARSSWI